MHNVDTTSVCDVETTLKERWYNFISTLFQLGLNYSKSCIKTSWASDKYRFAKSISKFYSANYFEQYINNSTTNKLGKSYNNFLTVHIGYKGENGDRKKALSFIISKVKNLLEKLWNPSVVTRIYDPSKSPAPRHHSFKFDSKITYLNSDQLSLSKHSKLSTPNLLQLMLNKSQMD